MTTGVYRANEIITERFKAVGFNSVTFGSITEKDIKKQTIMPLLHLVLTGVDHAKNSITVNYVGFMLDLIDDNNLDPREMKNEFRLANNVEDVFHDLNFKYRQALLSINKDVDINATVAYNSIDANIEDAQNKLCGYTINSFAITLEGNDLC